MLHTAGAAVARGVAALARERRGRGLRRADPRHARRRAAGGCRGPGHGTPRSAVLCCRDLKI